MDRGPAGRFGVGDKTVSLPLWTYISVLTGWFCHSINESIEKYHYLGEMVSIISSVCSQPSIGSFFKFHLYI